MRSSVKLVIMLIIYFFGAPSISYCDDAVYSGDGVNIYPIEETNVRLVSEEIKITQGEGLGWGVDVSINFKNEGPSTTVQMGFPFDAYSPDDGSIEDSDSTSNNTLDPHFRTFVDGQELKVTRRKASRNPRLTGINFPIVYTFDVFFQPGEMKTIRHTYSVGGYSDSAGNTKFKYILRTGALWKGTIDTINMSASLYARDIPRLSCINPEESSAEKVGDRIVLHWDLKNIKPDADLVISSNRRAEISKRTIEDLIKANKEELMTAPACKMRSLRNMVYASYGYPFKNPYVRAQFYYPGSPYRVNPSFSEKVIPQQYKDYVAFLLNVEKRRKLVQESMAKGLLPPEGEKESMQYPYTYDQVYVLAFNDAKKIAVGLINANLVILSWPDMAPRGYIKIPYEGEARIGAPIIRSRDISPDGKYFSFIGEYRFPVYGYKVIVVDIENRSVVSVKDSTIDDYRSNYLRYTRDSRSLVTLRSVIDVQTGTVVKSLPYNPQINERMIRSGEDSNFFYRYNNPYNEISVFDINTFDKVKTLKYTDHVYNLNISPDGRYLAGTFNQEELRGNQWTFLKAYFRIYEISGSELKLLHQEQLKDDDRRSEVAFGKRSDMVFIIKGDRLYRYDINPDGKIRIVKFEFNGAADQRTYMTFVHYKSFDAYGRQWDLETGRKTLPIWEVVYPSDSSRIFPFYEKTPSPISINTAIPGSGKRPAAEP